MSAHCEHQDFRKLTFVQHTSAHTRAHTPESVGGMAPTKTKTKPKPKLSLREELIAAGRASEKAPLDPTAVLEDIRNTISKIDNAVDSLGDAADQAQVRLAVEMGAKPEDVDALVARMAARKAAKEHKEVQVDFVF